jgi:hypothetical protein
VVDALLHILEAQEPLRAAAICCRRFRPFRS